MTTASYELIDTQELPWEVDPDVPGFFRRVLYLDTDTDAEAKQWYLPPGWGSDVHDHFPHRHYHATVTERAFVFSGDLPHWEYDDGPTQTKGEMVLFRRGWFMDRPPRSIHGIDAAPVSQTGCHLIYWNTGGGCGIRSPLATAETLDVPFEGDLEALGDDFTAARVFDTQGVAWENHPTMTGWKRKVLAEAGHGATRDVILHLPPDWKSDSLPLKGKPAPHRSWLYVLGGDLTLTVFPDRGKAETVSVHEGSYLAWEPGTSLGWTERPKSDIGCTILCIGNELVA
jgi:quercetin dioxygenase-like cupin family protein